MRIALLATAGIACLCVVVVPSMMRGQDQLPRGQGVTEYQLPFPVTRTINAESQVNAAADHKRVREIATVTKQLRDADNSAKRTEAKARLVELLSKDYDALLATHSEELDRLEEKLAQMRSRLKKRRAAKQDMIELRLKVLEAEATDLGWPTRNARSQTVRRSGYYYSNQRQPVPTGNPAMTSAAARGPSAK